MSGAHSRLEMDFMGTLANTAGFWPCYYFMACWNRRNRVSLAAVGRLRGWISPLFCEINSYQRIYSGGRGRTGESWAVDAPAISDSGMIVDLNLRGKRVLVVGAGHEAERKVEGLLSQGCEIMVVAGDLSERLQALWLEGRIKVKKVVVRSGGFLDYFDRLTLVMAVTDDREVNRKIVEAAKKRGIYTYAADDPAVSDFSHPAVINLHDKVQIAISTGGMSPLMARTLREKAEKIFKDMIRKEDLLQIELQDRLRGEIKGLLPSPEERKKFLVRVVRSDEIRDLLAENRLDDAATFALGWLKNGASGGA